jgi:hypothetical protein
MAIHIHRLNLISNWHAFNDMVRLHGHLNDNNKLEPHKYWHRHKLGSTVPRTHASALQLQQILPSQVNVMGRSPWHPGRDMEPLCTLVYAGQIQSRSL